MEIKEEELLKKFDCFNKFYDMHHIGCSFPGVYGPGGKGAVIVESCGKYLCEKCGREVHKEVWAGMFKKQKRIPRPFKKV